MTDAIFSAGFESGGRFYATSDRRLGIIAAGAFAASYLRTAEYLDIGRVDSLALALSLGAIYALRIERRGSRAVAAALLTLAFLAKQSSMFLAFALIAY